MKSGDAISSLLGIGFLLCAGFILVRPGGALNVRFQEWSEAASLRETVRDHWTALSNSGRRLGSDSGETRLVQFLDYQCGYCRNFRDSLRIAFGEHPEYSVRVRYKVSPGSWSSRQSALAAICAAQQGDFERMHDHLSTTTDWLTAQDWEPVGHEAEIRDIPGWLNCLSSDSAEAVLSEDSTWAAKLSLRGTPSLVTKRSGVHFGIVPVSTLEKWWR